MCFNIFCSNESSFHILPTITNAIEQSKKKQHQNQHLQLT